jgi:molybdopterin-guanine dinucleotide biosynthesis protein A
LELIVGIFVGGSGSRLGGVAKGLLKTPDAKTTLIERLRAEIEAALPGVEIVLVGSAQAYASLGLRTIADEPGGVGPLGGLTGLLAHAEHSAARHALALACDLPRLERRLIARLALESPEAAVVLAEQDGVRNPLIARYETRSALPAAQRALGGGKRSLQAVLDELEPRIVRLELSTDERASVGDWDTPDDVARDR